eukprot:1474083-Pyramimonas_sp.AAC.1
MWWKHWDSGGCSCGEDSCEGGGEDGGGIRGQRYSGNSGGDSGGNGGDSGGDSGDRGWGRGECGESGTVVGTAVAGT